MTNTIKTDKGLELRQTVQQKLPDPFFPEEREGWKGYIEWEKYPEKKKKAEEILAQYKFPEAPEFQLAPLPDSNPILDGERWKQYHTALGPTLEPIPGVSWKYVQQQKAKDMLHVLQFPYNGEPPRDRLVTNEFTDNKDFYIRNHGGVPEIEPEAYYVEVEGLVKNPKKFTLKDIQDESVFPRVSHVVSLQCSGTRRLEQIKKYPGDGDELINAPWGEGAIGNARWYGISLKKLIKSCGGLVHEDNIHVEFFGADTYFKKGQVYNYAVSVPYRKVKHHEVMLAWEMNGETLPRIHGGPLRAVVFGVIGARSCKWITRINVRQGASPGPVQKKEYLYYTAQIGKQNAMYSNGFSIQDMPVSSAIMTPVDKAQIMHDGKIHMTGWAYSGGGNWPVRVEVSCDGGNVWYEVPAENLSDKYYYSWRVWAWDFPCEAEGWLEFVVRTWDSSLNTQPTYQRSAWNWDMHVTSACHRISVYSVNKSRPATAARLKFLEEKGLEMFPLTKPLPIELEDEDHYEAEMERLGGRDPKE